MTNRRYSQNTRILTFLNSGRTLSAPQAARLFGAQSLSKRISELRAEGVAIETTTNRSGYTAYRLS
jgi:biotin operon repressor